MLCSYPRRTQCLDGFYDREPAARCAANFMSGLCLTAFGPSRKMIGAQSLFYPQRYPQELGSQKLRFLRHCLFSGWKSCGKAPLRFSLWRTIQIEARNIESNHCLITSFDYRFVRALQHAFARPLRRVSPSPRNPGFPTPSRRCDAEPLRAPHTSFLHARLLWEALAVESWSAR